MKTDRRKPHLGRTLALAAALSLCAAPEAASQYKVLHNFTGGPPDGVGTTAGVVLDQMGNLYGASGSGGPGSCPGGCGVVWELTPRPLGDWNFDTVYDFQGKNDGDYANRNVILDTLGNLYGTTFGGGAHHAGTAFELTPGSGAWTLNTLFAFCPKPGCSDQGGSESGLTRDNLGNLYGTKIDAVYELTQESSSWKEVMLHRFCAKGPPCNDGSGPYASLILDATGNLYATTSYGGTGCGGDGCGTVYELSPDSGGKWRETILHRFDNIGGDGVSPGGAALLMDSAGNLYGTTEAGGAYTGCAGVSDRPRSGPVGLAVAARPSPLVSEGNCGTVFKLTRARCGRWKERILHNFAPGAGGYLPGAGVVMDKSGNLYGTTDGGGNASGCGVLYKLAPTAKDKWKYSVLHTFGNGYDGCLPSGNLAIDSNGNLYGGTIFGGTYGYGVVFELTP